jgi:uncharacterized protein (DUF433 family)
MLTIDGQNNALSVPLRTDDQGVIRVGNSRVSLASIVADFHRGATPEQIVQDFDVLRLEDAYAVVAYYLQNQAELDAALEAERNEDEQIQRQAEARFPQTGIRERLLGRKTSEDKPT